MNILEDLLLGVFALGMVVFLAFSAYDMVDKIKRKRAKKQD